MRTAAKRLDAIIYAELNRRRASGDLGDDLLGLLLETRDGDDLPARPTATSATRS